MQFVLFRFICYKNYIRPLIVNLFPISVERVIGNRLLEFFLYSCRINGKDTKQESKPTQHKKES